VWTRTTDLTLIRGAL